MGDVPQIGRATKTKHPECKVCFFSSNLEFHKQKKHVEEIHKIGSCPSS